MIYPHEAHKEIKDEIYRSLTNQYEYVELEIHTLHSPTQLLTSHIKYDKITLWPLASIDNANEVFNKITAEFPLIEKKNQEGRFLCIIQKEKLD